MVKTIVPFIVLLFFIFSLHAQRNIYSQGIAEKVINKCQITENNNKYGILFENEIIAPYEYDEITYLHSGYYNVKKQNKYGIIGIIISDKATRNSISNFEIQIKKDIFFIGFTDIIPCMYNSIKEKPNGAFFVTKDNKQGIFNWSGSIKINCDYDSINEKTSGLFYVMKDGKHGIHNPSGSTKIPCIYDNIIEKPSGSFLVRKDKKQGIINPSGSTKIQCIYDGIFEKENGSFSVIKDNKQGIINPSGSIKISCVYDNIIEKENGSFSVIKDNKQGIINPSGSTKILCQYDQIMESPNGSFFVRKNGKQGIINPSGSIKIPCIYDEIVEKPNGLYYVIKDGKQGVMNPSGSIRISCEYDNIKESPDGLFQIKKDGKTETVRSSNQTKTEKTEYVVNNKRSSITIQSQGYTIQKKYDEIILINDSLRLVKRNGKYGISTNKGRLITPCKYDKIYNLYDELRPKKNSEMIIINQHNLKSFYIAQKENKFGLLNTRGEMVLDCIYDQISAKDEKIITVTKDNISKNIRISNL